MKTLLKPERNARTCACLLCGHRWGTMMQGREPFLCPKCRNPYWNVKPEFRPIPRKRSK